MIIRKLFKFEGAHIVRNCYTSKCKYNLHGHSFKVEVFLEGNALDRAGMLCDFSVLKNEVKDLIESFDHSYFFWNKESEELQSFIKGNFKRWISLPVSPSAENLSIIFYWFITKIINNTGFANGEGQIKVKAVRVHETDTGYAEASYEDLKLFPENIIDDDLNGKTSKNFVFSPSIMEDWKNNQILNNLHYAIPFVVEEPEQQIE